MVKVGDKVSVRSKAGPRPPDDTTRAAAAQAVEALLGAVERGEIEADTPQARRLARRLEGAVAAWKPIEDDSKA